MLQNRLSSSLQKKSPLKNSISKKWLGSISFEESLKEQQELKNLAQKGRFCFLGFEPRDTVITKGLRSDSKDILWDSNQLKQHSIKILSLKRGGQATLHSRGQLVLYPVVSLPLIGIKVKDFIVLLESITQAVLKDLNIDTKRLEKYSGLSSSKGKIAFFGIHISQGISQHGLSISVSNPLHLFSSIKSCGVADRDHDSLLLQKINMTTKELYDRWIEKSMMFL